MGLFGFVIFCLLLLLLLFCFVFLPSFHSGGKETLLCLCCCLCRCCCLLRCVRQFVWLNNVCVTCWHGWKEGNLCFVVVTVVVVVVVVVVFSVYM